MSRKMQRTLVTLIALSTVGASTAWGQMSSPTPNQLPPKNEAATQSKMPETQKVEGTIQSVDSAMHSITLDDGTTLMIPASVKVAPSALKKGAKVSASFTEQSGKRVVTSLRVEQPAKS